MHFKSLGWVICLTCFVSARWTSEISGKVVNENGDNIDGAVIKSLAYNEIIVTGSDGNFIPTGTVRGNKSIVTKYGASVDNGILTFQLESNKLVLIDLYSLQGRSIHRINSGILSKGIHKVALNSLSLPTQLYIIKMRIGRDSYSTKFINGRKFSFRTSSAGNVQPRALAKKGIWIDTLEVSHSDYVTKLVPIANYKTPLTITLFGSGNTKPEITCPTNILAYAYENVTFSVEATDPDGGDVTLSLNNAPGSATLESGVFSWQTSKSDEGSYEFEISADDGSETSTHTVNLEIVFETEADTCKRVKVLRPNGGEVYKVGDTMTVVWVTIEDGIYRGVRVIPYPDYGLTEPYSLNEDDGLRNDDPQIYTGNLGVFHWKVEAQWPGIYGVVNMVSDSCYMSIYGDYERERLMGAGECDGPSSGFARDFSDAPYSIIE